MLLGDGRAQTLQALDVKIDGTHSNRASTRQRDSRTSAPCYERTQHQRRGAHLLHQFVGSLGRSEGAAADRSAMLGASISQFDLRPHRGEKLARGFNVSNLWDV